MMSSKSLEKLSAVELKAMLKAKKMSQTGDKGTMLFRIGLAQKCDDKHLVTAEGSYNPCNLSFPELKKHASKVGVSPIGTQDEVLTEYIKYLESHPAATASSSSSSSPSTENIDDDNTSSSSSNKQNNNNNGSGIDPTKIAQQIIDYAENEDYESIMNMTRTSSSDPMITKQTPVPVMRKAYLKLSLIIHPDKIGRIFPQATKAFQALVKAFDYLTSVDIDVTGETTAAGGKKGGKTKTFTISRSNEGCYRTRVCCPRCRQPWSEGALDGNPPYFYNFLMQGLKCYTCSTCLCEFGCMTAIHKCPHCKKSFEYSIEDYHRKIQCPNNHCNKTFGFYLYPVSDRVMSELRHEIKREQEEKIKIRESKLRRAERMMMKGSSSSGLSKTESEKAFLLGLVDNCPRCGETFEGYPDEESQRQHLLECTDSEKHAVHKQNEKEKIEKQLAKEKKLSLQDDAQTQAAFTFLGSQSSQLWLLNSDQVKQQAFQNGIDISGCNNDKDEIIARISKAQNKKIYGDDDEEDENEEDSNRTERLMVLDKDNKPSSSSSSSSALTTTTSSNHQALITKKRKRCINADNLPSNLHSLSVSQLRSVCAANGLLKLLTPDSTRNEILDVIEDALYDEE